MDTVVSALHTGSHMGLVGQQAPSATSCCTSCDELHVSLPAWSLCEAMRPHGTWQVHVARGSPARAGCVVVNPMLASCPTPVGLNVVWYGPSGRDVEAVPLGPCTACGARMWMKKPHILTTLCRHHLLLWLDVGRYNCACMCCRSRAGRAAWWHCRRC